MICFLVGCLIGKRTITHEEIIKTVQGKTIRDTITHLVLDTVYLTGELKYKYIYKTDTIFKDVPVIDREATIAATVRDWNKVRKYSKQLFDNENGKLEVNFSIRYNELQKLSYAFTPMHKEITIVKKRVFVPFISVSYLTNNTFSVGGGGFFYNLGLRIEYSSRRMNFVILYEF